MSEAGGDVPGNFTARLQAWGVFIGAVAIPLVLLVVSGMQARAE